ncbi:hypothetical protein EV368DRAFT_80189 [Lentinula lateritia]|nr:hypothetical protein EV368DRAFT_80189 [Lentinula lateritia]
MNLIRVLRPSTSTYVIWWITKLVPPPSPPPPPPDCPADSAPVLSEIEAVWITQEFIRALRDASLKNGDLEAESPLAKLLNPSILIIHKELRVTSVYQLTLTQVWICLPLAKILPQLREGKLRYRHWLPSTANPAPLNPSTSALSPTPDVHPRMRRDGVYEIRRIAALALVGSTIKFPHLLEPRTLHVFRLTSPLQLAGRWEVPSVVVTNRYQSSNTVLSHTFDMHMCFLLSPFNAKSQLLYAYFLLVAVLSVTVVAAPSKLAPQPLAPNVVVLSLGYSGRPALFFRNNYGLTAGRDPRGHLYVYRLHSAQGLQNLGPGNTQLMAYFRNEAQVKNTLATLRDLEALGQLGASSHTMLWPLITDAKDYIHAMLTYLSQLPSGFEGHATVVDARLLSEWQKQRDA